MAKYLYNIKIYAKTISKALKSCIIILHLFVPFFYIIRLTFNHCKITYPSVTNFF